MDDGAVLGIRALNRALLARQHLLARADGSVLDLVEHLVGLQAQEPQEPYVGVLVPAAPVRAGEPLRPAGGAHCRADAAHAPHAAPRLGPRLSGAAQPARPDARRANARHARAASAGCGRGGLTAAGRPVFAATPSTLTEVARGVGDQWPQVAATRRRAELAAAVGAGARRAGVAAGRAGAERPRSAPGSARNRRTDPGGHRRWTPLPGRVPACHADLPGLVPGRQAYPRRGAARRSCETSASGAAHADGMPAPAADPTPAPAGSWPSTTPCSGSTTAAGGQRSPTAGLSPGPGSPAGGRASPEPGRRRRTGSAVRARRRHRAPAPDRRGADDVEQESAVWRRSSPNDPVGRPAHSSWPTRPTQPRSWSSRCSGSSGWRPRDATATGTTIGAGVRVTGEQRHRRGRQVPVHHAAIVDLAADPVSTWSTHAGPGLRPRRP